MSQRLKQNRLRPLSESDVLSLSEVAHELRMRKQEANSWMEDNGIIRNIRGRKRVIWGDVLDLVRTGEGGRPKAPKGNRVGLKLPLTDKF